MRNIVSLCSDKAQALADKAMQLGVRSKLITVDLSHHQINATLGKNSHYTQQVEEFMLSHDPALKPFLNLSPQRQS